MNIANITAADPLVKALTARMKSNPMLANEVVTGICAWPNENGTDWLYNEAVDLLKEAESDPHEPWYRSLTRNTNPFRLDQLRAAVDALADIANEEDQARSAEERLMEDGVDVRIA